MNSSVSYLGSVLTEGSLPFLRLDSIATLAEKQIICIWPISAGSLSHLNVTVLQVVGWRNIVVEDAAHLFSDGRPVTDERKVPEKEYHKDKPWIK